MTSYKISLNNVAPFQNSIILFAKKKSSFKIITRYKRHKFFLMEHDVKSEDIGVGQFIDFGHTKKFLSAGKTKPLQKIFTTLGYLMQFVSKILSKAMGKTELA